LKPFVIEQQITSKQPARDWGNLDVNLWRQNMAIEKNIASASIAEVVDRILDKGVVIDAFVRISLVGIELIAIEVRAVVSSVETWLKYAEAVGLTVDPATA